ncbi:fkbM_fam, methyltransferase, FkbM family [uncultured Caudovirales phage]|uniref:FkbM_fam, methyltransferase, FkbM family n=1 Tax=uncultured Caudovirales phage TaxID=2100421 RepID=A0A6J5LIW3_9CAUD|nr:fkbM_fam, methyltransferase, FkbM family [uncultured Caudovirales phage]
MLKSVKGRWGETWFIAKDEYVGKSLYQYGEYNPDETEMILSLADKNRVCLDVGANIGVMAQALEANGFKCIAFEPQTEIYNVLVKNFKGEAHNCAVGATEGTVTLPKLYYSEKGNYGGISVNTKSIYGSYVKPLLSLDHLFENGEIDVGFIKIDVEGFELEVLKGATKLINRCKPILYIEDDRVGKSVDLRRYIRELGYSIEPHYPPLFREDNFFGNKKNVWDKIYVSHNLICRPC